MVSNLLKFYMFLIVLPVNKIYFLIKFIFKTITLQHPHPHTCCFLYIQFQKWHIYSSSNTYAQLKMHYPSLKKRHKIMPSC